MPIRTRVRWGPSLVCLGALACGPAPAPETVLFRSALDSVEAVLTKSGVTADAGTYVEGSASLRIDATGPTTIRLAEVAPEETEGAILLYRAQLRAQDLSGRAFLEMWCRIAGRGEFFSRALDAPVTGTTDWVSQQTPFLLEVGQRADLVKLNLVVDGVGTVWIDDLELAMAPR